VRRNVVAFDLEDTQAAIELPAVVLTRDRLLARVAALAEADVRLRQSGFRRQHAIVDLAPPARDAGLDPPALERLIVDLFAFRSSVEDFFAAEDEPRIVFLRLDLRLRREAEAQQLVPDALAELGFGEDEVVVLIAPQHAERRDHARLRGQQQRVAGLTDRERLDVVRDHPLQVLARIGTGDANERARSPNNSTRRER